VTSQFSVLLRQLRRQTELTQEDLAQRAGLSVRTIRRLETGVSANPQLDTVRLLADALRLAPDKRARMLAVADGREVPEPSVVTESRPESPFELRLAEATDDLAHAVGARLGREEELRRIQDPFPLPVRWQLAPDDVMDHWENICRRLPGESARPLDLAGRLPEVAEIHGRIPSGRLVVLGRAGSGKSVLAARFVLDILRTRARGDAVPVVFGLGSWNPTSTGFRDWLAGQLVRDHPGLAATGRDGESLATALVEAGRVLPVLDGFDELATGLHRAALDALNATTLPLLLTSRPGEYATVARTDPLTAAAAVRLTDLTVADLADYLPRTTRRTGGATAWDPVLAELRDHPERPACVNLRAVLTTPLMVGLARASYSAPAGRDPAVLLDVTRFGSQHELEDHLLGSFIPTVYQEPDQGWDAERVRGWLSYLAQHLDRLGTHDLAWWQLGGAMRRGTRMLVVGLVSGLVVALVSGLLIGLVAAAVGEDGSIALTAMLGNLLGFGLAFGLAHGAGITLGGGAFEPSRVRLRTRGGGRQLRARFGPRLAIGLVGGAGLGLVLGLAAQEGLEPMGLSGVGFLGGLGTGVGLGVLAGLGWGLMAGLEAPVDIRSSVGPTDLLRTNRATVLVEFLGWGLVLGLAHLVVITLAAGHLNPAAVPLDLVLGPLIGLMIGICLTAWGNWVVFARVWLPLTGRLPWSVVAFLDDACRRGVLRQVGAVYQFRHARLQAHLAGPG
jgi:transcriptional regulator with XRE-family HTH domain